MRLSNAGSPHPKVKVGRAGEPTTRSPREALWRRLYWKNFIACRWIGKRRLVMVEA